MGFASVVFLTLAVSLFLAAFTASMVRGDGWMED